MLKTVKSLLKHVLFYQHSLLINLFIINNIFMDYTWKFFIHILLYV